MKTKFSRSWKRSIQPRKQRKFRLNAPLHIRRKFVRSNLSRDLRKKYGIRSIGTRKGDKTKIMRGKFKGKSGKVNKVNLKKSRVYIDGIERNRRDGGKAFIGVDPSNLMITELNLDDKMRKKALNRKIQALSKTSKT